MIHASRRFDIFQQVQRQEGVFLECGGKRSATPLWIGRARRNPLVQKLLSERESAVAAALCRRTPNVVWNGEEVFYSGTGFSPVGQVFQPDPSAPR